MQTLYEEPCSEILAFRASADLDGDGDTDLIRNCGWLENDGNGNFDTINYWDSSYTFDQVVTGDVDGDGDIDLAVRAGSIFLMRNDGSGEFDIELISGASFRIEGLADADLDGDLDLFCLVAFTSNTGFECVWMENKGDSFEGPNYTGVVMPQLLGSVDLEMADLDLDGDVDLGTAIYGEFGVYRNLEGSFVHDTTFVYDVGLYENVFADHNGDGYLDVVSIANAENGGIEVSVQESDGSGGFAEFVYQTFEGPLYFDNTILDLNADSKLDILSLGEGIKVFLNDELGGFVQQESPTLDEVDYTYCTAVKFAEEGKYKLLYHNPSISTTAIIGVEAPASIQTLKPYYGTQVQDWEVFDIDSDGDRDILALFYNAGLLLFENQQDSFAEARLLLRLHAQNQMTAADTDMDGRDELWFSGSSADQTIRCFEIDADGELQLDQSYDGPTNYVHVFEFHDIQGDGIEDLVMWQAQNQVYYGDGEGNLMPPEPLVQIPNGTYAIYGVDMMDWDVDGLTDAVIYSPTPSGDLGLSVCRNTGIAPLEQPQTLVTLNGDNQSFLDVDEDGDFDVLVRQGGLLGDLILYENQAGAIVNQQVLATDLPPLGSAEFLQHELNSDEHKDLIIDNRFMLNDGNGNYQLSATIASHCEYNTLADLIGDEKEELLRFENGKLVLYEKDETITSTAIEPNQETFSIAPNPAHDMMRLCFAEDRSDAYTVTIYSSSGQLQWRQVIASDGNVDVSKLSGGTYLLQVSLGDENLGTLPVEILD